MQKPLHLAFPVGFDVKSPPSPRCPGCYQRGQEGPPSGLRGLPQAAQLCLAPSNASPEFGGRGTRPGVSGLQHRPSRSMGVSPQYYLKLPCSRTWKQPCDSLLSLLHRTRSYLLLYGRLDSRAAGRLAPREGPPSLPLICGTKRARVPPGLHPAGPALQEQHSTRSTSEGVVRSSPVVFNCVTSV